MTTPESSMNPSPPSPKPNKKMFLLLGGGAGLVFIIFLCICSGIGVGWFALHSSSNSIVGKWKADDGSAVIEFKSDGTCVTELGGFTITGTYSTSGGKITTVSKNPDGTTATETDDYSISGNQLTVTSTVGPMTKTLKFTRQ